MALLEIKVLGCPILRKRALPVEVIAEEAQRLIDDMFDTMYAAEGIGLAAPQVGVGQRLFVLDVGPRDASAEPMALINPEVLWSAGEVVEEEGCLSLPEVVGEVARAAHVRVGALDREGTPFEVEMSGIGARAAQHEIDHLNGVLVIDRFSTIKRNLLRGQLRRLKRQGKRQAPGLTYAADEAVNTQ